MKKPTFEIILRHKRRAKNRLSRRNRKNNKDASIITIKSPECLELLNENYHNETCIFISQIRQAGLAGKIIKVDFSKTKKVFSCGTLLFLAEIDRLKKNLLGKFKISCNYPKDEVVEKVFQQVGILALFNKKPRKNITEQDANVYYWQYKTGTAVNLRIAATMLKGIKEKLPAQSKKIVRGVEEAMTNVIHHAYTYSRGDGLDSYPHGREKRWWVFATIHDGWLFVAMCDLGIGIPRSLPTKWSDQLKDVLTATYTKKRREIALTQRAFVVGRTSTDKKHRGKGLKDILDAAKNLGGKLWLTTNQVQLRYDYSSGSDNSSQSYYRHSIRGTLIQWSIPIPPVKSEAL